MTYRGSCSTCTVALYLSRSLLIDPAIVWVFDGLIVTLRNAKVAAPERTARAAFRMGWEIIVGWMDFVRVCTGVVVLKYLYTGGNLGLGVT